MTGRYTDYSEPYLKAKELMRLIHDLMLAGKTEDAMRYNVTLISELVNMQEMLARISK